MFAGMSSGATVALTIYTDAFVIRGSIMTRHRRVTDILNQADEPFLVLSDVTIDEFGARAQTQRAEHAQVNLGAVLFAVGDTEVEALPELRTPKVSETAMISVPPFKITGRIHLLPNANIDEALRELTGKFIPATDATYWSDVVGEPRTKVAVVAFNHSRAQILAPHREVDPWAGLGATTDATQGDAASAPIGQESSGW
jgi:hypothetical protein